MFLTLPASTGRVATLCLSWRAHEEVIIKSNRHTDTPRRVRVASRRRSRDTLRPLCRNFVSIGHTIAKPLPTTRLPRALCDTGEAREAEDRVTKNSQAVAAVLVMAVSLGCGARSAREVGRPR